MSGKHRTADFILTQTSISTGALGLNKWCWEGWQVGLNVAAVRNRLVSFVLGRARLEPNFRYISFGLSISAPLGAEIHGEYKAVPPEDQRAVGKRQKSVHRRPTAWHDIEFSHGFPNQGNGTEAYRSFGLMGIPAPGSGFLADEPRTFAS